MVSPDRTSHTAHDAVLRAPLASIRGRSGGQFDSVFARVMSEPLLESLASPNSRFESPENFDMFIGPQRSAREVGVLLKRYISSPLDSEQLWPNLDLRAIDIEQNAGGFKSEPVLQIG